MKLKITEIIRLFGGLVGLDGLQKSNAKDGALYLAPFKFRGKFTILKATLIGILRVRIDAYNTAVEDIRKQHAEDPAEDAEITQKRSGYIAAMIELNAVEHEVPGLTKFTLADLNLYDEQDNPKGNQIVSTVLEQVMPLIEADPAPGEKPAPEAE